jgi:hypothetical protein
MMFNTLKVNNFQCFIERHVACETMEPVTLNTKRCAAGCYNVILLYFSFILYVNYLLFVPST